MNTEDFYLVENLDFNMDSVEIFELEYKDTEMLSNFIEITRFIQEIEQLFRVYRSNLSMLLSLYTLYSSDIINRKIELHGDGWTDYSNINSLTINLISAGKVLIGAIGVYQKAFYGDNSKEYKDFKRICLNQEYDSSFGYRFLTRLRDFSQHGHLPVSLSETEKGVQVCFNIDRILPTPHFSHNATLMTELLAIREDIHKNFGNPAKVAFTLTVAQYNLSVTTIYSSFYKAEKNAFFDACNMVDTFINETPEAIIKSDTPLNGMVGYFNSDDISNLHLFNPKNDTRKMFLDFSQNADDILTQEVTEFVELKKSFKRINKKANEG